MKYYIIAGESSGDLHGSNLIRSILAIDEVAEFQYWGGNHMTEVTEGRLVHIRETAIMGFAEVVLNISKIKGFFKLAKKTILEYQPDVVILIDYPGFNLRMAKWSHQQGFKTAFYISPQLWAWKKGRKETIRKYVDEMIVILPFEKEWYLKENIESHYVGHPLVEAIENTESNLDVNLGLDDSKPILAILPGSRNQEVRKILPLMGQAAVQLKEKYHLVIAATDHLTDDDYYTLLPEREIFHIVRNHTYELVRRAKVALVTSGTATLETALLDTPQVVCYKTASINYMIGKRLVDLKYISLVNLILDKSVVPELIQHDLTTENILYQIEKVISDTVIIKSNYSKLRSLLKLEKSASQNAAEIIIKLAKR